MKHLKKLSVVLMMTTLFSVSFTSCIDNEVSPLVEAIYEAQADLIAAQAGVQNAEAALLLAEAQAEEAQANLIAAQTAQVEVYTAGMEADNAYEAAQHEQYLLELVAQTSLDVAALQNELALAQIQFDIDMAELIADMEAAGAELAAEYAWDYAYAMQHANDLMQQLLGAKADLASAQLMLVDPDGTGTGTEVSYAYYLAQLENKVAIIEANITAAEAHIATLEENAADPIAAKELLEAEKIALRAEYEELLQVEEAQKNVIAAINFDVIERNTYVSQLTSALSDHNASLTSRIVREGWIANAETLIAGHEEAILNYAGITTTLEGAVTTATAAVNAAILALGDEADFDGYYTKDADGVAIAIGGTKYATPANLQEVLVNATIDQLEAASELSILTGQIASLYTSLQTAAGVLASAQQSYNSGIAAVTTDNTTAGTAVTNAQTALATAQSNYNTWKAVFEANPAGVTWFDKTTILGNVSGASDLYTNTFLGDKTDAINTSYRKVLTWAETVPASGDFYPATYEATSVATIPADGGGIDYEEFTGTPLATATPTIVYFVEVEADDISETNLAIFNAMVAALGDEDIFDIAPALPVGYPTTTATSLYKGDSDAWSVLWDAQLWKLETQYVLDNFGTALADAELAYETLRDIYENELDLLNTAQAEKVAADDAFDDAKEDVDEAWVALGQNFPEGEAGYTKRLPGDAVPTTSLTLNEVEYNAEIDLANHLDTTVAQYEAWIVTQEGLIALWTEQITNIQVYIDAKYAVVAGLLAELDTLGVEYTFEVDEDGFGTFTVTNDTVLGASYSDLRAELIAANQVLWEIQRDIAIVQSEQTAVSNLLSQWNTSYNTFVNTTIPNLKASLVLLETDLEEAKAALALAVNAETAAEAHIAYLEALIETLEARHANTLAIAAKYKALMDAALAS